MKLRDYVPVRLRHCLSLVLAAACVSCTRHNVTVLFFSADRYSFSDSERNAIQVAADSAARDVRRLLPMLPPDLVLRVQPSSNVVAETGEDGYSTQPNSIGWLVDPHHPGGVTATVRRELRGTLFHEFHHMLRYAAVGTPRSLMDDVIAEGMATAFERDGAGTSPPWGVYPADVANWVTELRALPRDADHTYWLDTRHDDGRRWIGMRVGTYLVDRAMRSPGTSFAQLISTPTEAVLQMASGH